MMLHELRGMFMKISIEFFKSSQYQSCKRDLLDPDMGLEDLHLTVRFNNFGDEIILEESEKKHDIIRIESVRTYFGIYFANGNCVEIFHEDATLEVKFI